MEVVILAHDLLSSAFDYQHLTLLILMKAGRV